MMGETCGEPWKREKGVWLGGLGFKPDKPGGKAWIRDQKSTSQARLQTRASSRRSLAVVYLLT